jgi:long-chain fatty acid transport protein
MQSRRMLLVVSCVLVAGLASSVWSAGFALYEGGARGNALGGTMVARDPDPSSIYVNPAAITDLEGAHVGAGVTAIRPVVDVETLTAAGKVTTESDRNTWLPPHAYGTYQINDKVWSGVGVYSRFGLGSEFDPDWPGRFNSYKADIQTVTVNPNIALKLDDHFSLAAGLSAMWFDLDLRRKIPVMGSELDFILTGDSWGYGYNAGLRYKLNDRVAAGIAYQSTITQEIEGSADVGVLGKSDASGDIKLPDMVFVGVAVKPIDKLSVEIGGVYTRWSTYDELSVRIDDPTLLGKTTVRSEKDWDDVWRYAAGVEYEAAEALVLRAGYVYDQTPDPDATADYLVPANDRHIFSVGAGYNWRSWKFDLSYSYLYIMDRDIPARPADGVYQSKFVDGHSHLIGATISKAL